MRWQQPARWSVAVVGLGVAVALYVQTRERPPADRPPVATPADPEASVQSAGGTSVRFRNDVLEFEIEHKGEKVYPDGRSVLIEARINVGDGTTLYADEVETSGDVSAEGDTSLHLRGNVQMDTPEGASIRTDEARYNNSTGVAVMPGTVAFARGRISGSGTGGEYHRDTGVFHVLADARVVTTGTAGDQVEATARSMTFNRAGMALLFVEDVRLLHEKQTMAADRATLYLAEDQELFRVIELRGRARVTPVAGQDAGVPEMEATDIDLAFHEGTQILERAVLTGGSRIVFGEGAGRRSIDARDINLTTAADGQTLTHLDARERVVVRTPASAGQAARTISAAALVAGGDDAKGLTSADFSGGVRFVESHPGRGATVAERTGTSRTLTMALAGGLDAVESARFMRDVTFRQGDVSGDADVGDYDSSAGRLTLRPGSSASRFPRVVSGQVTVDARQFIDVDLDTQNVHARGEVKTVTAERARQSGAPPGLFDAQAAMLGFGEEFWYDPDAGRARYQGAAGTPARVQQGDTEVVAQTIELAEETQDLTAGDGVVVTFLAAESAAAGAPLRKFRVASTTLEYRSAARTASYTGNPVTLTAPDGVTVARTMVMTLAAEGRTLEQLDARGEVHARMGQGREALADALLYEAASGRYTLRGQPLVLRMANESPGSCSRWEARVATFLSDGSPPEFPPAENPGPIDRRGVSCTAPLQ